LEDDPARLENIIDVMWAQVHKVLRRPLPRRRRSGGSDVAGRIGAATTDQLTRAGVSADDVLADALADLLQKSETAVTTTWEALAVGIARKKTMGALRDAESWIHETEHRPRLIVVPGDAPGRPDPDGEAARPLFELLEDPKVDLDDEFTKTSQQLELLRLAREVLDDRDRAIFLGLHFETCTRQSLATQFGLTPPGVTHIYRTAAKRLYAHPRFQRYAERGAL
jgi:DNA-directed RNA polymerase specialized sigma24 family protein